MIVAGPVPASIYTPNASPTEPSTSEYFRVQVIAILSPDQVRNGDNGDVDCAYACEG